MTISCFSRLIAGVRHNENDRRRRKKYSEEEEKIVNNVEKHDINKCPSYGSEC